MEEKKYIRQTSIQLDKEVKSWLCQKMQVENRSLSNLVNTILKHVKEEEKVSWQQHPAIKETK